MSRAPIDAVRAIFDETALAHRRFAGHGLPGVVERPPPSAGLLAPAARSWPSATAAAPPTPSISPPSSSDGSGRAAAAQRPRADRRFERRHGHRERLRLRSRVHSPGRGARIGGRHCVRHFHQRPLDKCRGGARRRQGLRDGDDCADRTRRWTDGTRRGSSPERAGNVGAQDPGSASDHPARDLRAHREWPRPAVG